MCFSCQSSIFLVRSWWPAQTQTLVLYSMSDFVSGLLQCLGSSEWYAFKMQRIQKITTKDGFSPEKACGGKKIVQLSSCFCKNWFSSFLDSISAFMAYLSCPLVALIAPSRSLVNTEIPLPTTCCACGSHKAIGLTHALWINLWANCLFFLARKNCKNWGWVWNFLKSRL